MKCRKCGTTGNVEYHGVTPVCGTCWDRFIVTFREVDARFSADTQV